MWPLLLGCPAVTQEALSQGTGRRDWVIPFPRASAQHGDCGMNAKDIGGRGSPGECSM